jgi:solute carrier family 25 iron transporter 28/37
MQVHNSTFPNIAACARHVYRSEGLKAFYISYLTTLAITIPFNAIQYTVYEHMKRYMNPQNHYSKSPSTHIGAGGVAGAVAAAVTTPLDITKTILQTRGMAKDADIKNCSGMMDAFRVIWRRDGMRGFGRGLTPRVLTIMPSSALCWMSYEFFSESLFFIHLTVLFSLTGAAGAAIRTD